MNRSFQILRIAFVTLCINTSCSKEEVSVEFMKFQNNLVLFTVENNLESDIYSIEFEISYFNSENELLKIDTVDYQKTSDVTGNQIPFVKAGEATFFTYGMPDKTAAAQARTLKYSFENKSK